MIISTTLTRPMYLNERNLDTALKLGTSDPETFTISKLGEIGPLGLKPTPPTTMSKLGEIDPLELTLAPQTTITKHDGMDSLKLTLGPPSTISKHEETDPLTLKLAPPSQLTTKKSVLSGTYKPFGALGIKKSGSFKHTHEQPKQTFKITPDDKMWLEDQIIEFKSPVSHPPRDPHSVLSYKDSMIEDYPSNIPTHNLQGSSSINSNLYEAEIHSLPVYYGSGSNSDQGFPTHDLSAKNLVYLMESQHHPIIDPSFGNRPVQTSLEETEVSGTDSSRYEETLPSPPIFKDVIDPDGRKSISAIRDDLFEFSNFGEKEIWKRDEIRQEISTWFEVLRETLINKIQAEGVKGIATRDVSRALSRARKRLIMRFFGFLINRDPRMAEEHKDSLIVYGWDYLKSCMVKWEDVNLATVVNFKFVPVGTGVWNWTPEETLAYFMWVEVKNTLESRVLSKFIAGWEELRGS